MFDTMTGTKVVGAFCGALLVFLFAQWAGESLYHVGGHASGLLEVADVSTEGTENVKEEIDFGALLASADPERGRKVFAKCKACHMAENGKNGVGPHLFAIVGRPVASVDGFRYSSPMEQAGGVWLTDSLNAFLENPKKYLPGTKMAFQGLKKAADRANVISFLSTLE